MPTKFTPQSSINGIATLSEPTKAALEAAGFSILAHLDDVDFADVARLLFRPPDPPRGPRGGRGRGKDPARVVARERRALFVAAIKAGVAPRFQPDAELSLLPILSANTVATLRGAGYVRFTDLAGVYYPDVYELLGSYGIGKDLLLGLVLGDVNVRFASPGWGENDWRVFVERAVEGGVVGWEDVAVALCGELNPPQVGTAVARAVKHRYPRGRTMQNVWQWLYAQDGRCAVSGKRLFLEVDHIESKETFIKRGEDPKEADRLENFQLLSKRENVIKRGSHKRGGISFMPSAAIMPYLLLHHKPRIYAEFAALCRNHGLTMADVRFQEGWALAAWLQRAGVYEIDGEVAPFIRTATDADLDESEGGSTEAAEASLLGGGGNDR